MPRLLHSVYSRIERLLLFTKFSRSHFNLQCSLHSPRQENLAISNYHANFNIRIKKTELIKISNVVCLELTNGQVCAPC